MKLLKTFILESLFVGGAMFFTTSAFAMSCESGNPEDCLATSKDEPLEFAVPDMKKDCDTDDGVRDVVKEILEHQIDKLYDKGMARANAGGLTHAGVILSCPFHWWGAKVFHRDEFLKLEKEYEKGCRECGEKIFGVDAEGLKITEKVKHAYIDAATYADFITRMGSKVTPSLDRYREITDPVKAGRIAGQEAAREMAEHEKREVEAYKVKHSRCEKYSCCNEYHYCK